VRFVVVSVKLHFRQIVRCLVFELLMIRHDFYVTLSVADLRLKA